MKNQTRQALNACFVVTGGLICGWITFFYSPVDCVTGGIIEGLALFVAGVLFNALLAGIVSGLLLSCLVFPLEYFLIKRFNRAIGVVIFIIGLLIGSIVPQVVAVLSQVLRAG
ncbi:MAG TPA: hypothetical protein PL155_09460 [Candidatus Omnitrophota bacterium]|nr:hypothetical protein [Candidatus Omnitrophota bacterium]HPD85673.1 hypothetical protein [Candidatus Omnitrophota bacterium]HRZ04516.1 hypothetical protein [Candidatus Omnitrophota bacterium]